MQNSNANNIKIKSPAKINFHLEILGKREDGYHEIAMIMQNIDLSDYLVFERNNKKNIILTCNCKELCLDDENLIIKAAKLLKEITNNKELGADIFLTKNIPIGAGLAGGSSNAASCLLGLNKLWNLNFDYDIIHQLATKLGSDVPFFINGGTKFCYGRGEILEDYNFEKELGIILLKNPLVSISTSKAYSSFSKQYGSSFNLENNSNSNLNLNKFFQNKFIKDKIMIRNDLQPVVENENESVKNALKLLSELKDNIGFSMSGSGPTCFAIFENINKANKAFENNKHKFKHFGFDAWVCKLLNKGVTFI